MNWDQIEGKWTQFKGKAKEKWGDITDDDLDKIDGKRDQLVGKLQENTATPRIRLRRKWTSSPVPCADKISFS